MSENLELVQQWIVFDFRDGKISRTRTFLDRGEASRAAGAAE